MGKKTPKAPAAPDPYATAQAQGQMNKDTAIANANLNRINQYTPEGSLEFRQIGTNADGTPQYASYQTYSPGEQQLYDTQNQVSNALSGLALNNVNRVNQAQAQPFNYDNMTPLQTQIARGGINWGYDPAGQAQTQIAGAGDINRNIAGAGDIQRQIGDAGDIQGNYASGGNIQKGLDFSNLSGIPGIGDYGAEAKRVQDAVYNQATSRLDPQWQQQQQQLTSQLAAKGVTEGSAAYRNAMDQMMRQRTDAYNQANFSGIQAGSQEQSRLFGLAMQGRQQGASELQAQGAFANQAQAQAEAQNAARAGFGNQAQAQRYGQMANNAQFGNEAQNQLWNQNAAQAAFGNQAQAQQYEQNANNAAFYNQGQAQQNAQNAAQAAFNNTAQGQDYQQNANNAAFNNQARQQQIQEATYLRNLPLNEIASLLGTGGGVSNPQFASYANANVAPTDYSGIVQNNYAQAMGQYNQQMANRSSALGSIFGTLGSIGGAAIMASDRRLKTDIKKVGTMPNGINTYTFRYLLSPILEYGVMADEVQQVLPEAVAVNDNGFMTVDYGKVYSYGG